MADKYTASVCLSDGSGKTVPTVGEVERKQIWVSDVSPSTGAGHACVDARFLWEAPNEAIRAS